MYDTMDEVIGKILSPQEDCFIEANRYLNHCDAEERRELLLELKLDYGIKDPLFLEGYLLLSDFAAFELFSELKQKQYYKMGYFEEGED